MSPLPATAGFLFSISLLHRPHVETKPVPIVFIAGLQTASSCLISVINNVANAAPLVALEAVHKIYLYLGARENADFPNLKSCHMNN